MFVIGYERIERIDSREWWIWERLWRITGTRPTTKRRCVTWMSEVIDWHMMVHLFMNSVISTRDVANVKRMLKTVVNQIYGLIRATLLALDLWRKQNSFLTCDNSGILTANAKSKQLKLRIFLFLFFFSFPSRFLLWASHDWLQLTHRAEHKQKWIKRLCSERRIFS